MINRTKGLATFLLGLTLFGCTNLSENYEKTKVEGNFTVVETGEARHSNGKNLISRNFMNCSAIIFDYGEDAFMAHALPYSPHYFFPVEVNTHNVVNKGINELELRGIDPKKAKVIIHAGESEGLQRILTDLEKQGISVFSINSMANLPFINSVRDISYNPKTDELGVEFIHADDDRYKAYIF